MKPKIEKSKFGSITIGGIKYEYDILIRLDGEVVKRRKKLSKQLYGTSHILSLDEAVFVFEQAAQRLVIGSGQDGMLKLSTEAEAFFKEKGCKVKLMPTPEAIEHWNKAKGNTIGLFHITC